MSAHIHMIDYVREIVIMNLDPDFQLEEKWIKKQPRR